MRKLVVLLLVVLVGLLVASQALAGGKKPSKEEQIRLVVQPMLDTLSTGITISIRKEIATETQSLGDSLTHQIKDVAGRTSAVRGEVKELGTRLDAAEAKSDSLEKDVQNNVRQISELSLTWNQRLAAQKEEFTNRLTAMEESRQQEKAAQGQEIKTLEAKSAKRSAWRVPRFLGELAIALIVIIHVTDHSGR